MNADIPPCAKFEIIKNTTTRDDNLFSIQVLCEIAGVSRSGYYRWLSTEPARTSRDECDKADFALIMEAYQHRGYDKGARGIYMRLLHQKVIMNVKKIRRLMRKYSLKCPIRKANPYRRMMKKMQTSKIAKNHVNRCFTIYGPRAVLLTDITYIPRENGEFTYLSVIIDACTKQALAYVCSDSLEVDFVLETVKILMKSHGDTLNSGEKTLLHSDQGSHYTSNALIDIIKNSDLRQSMSRKANCWDNAPQESFFGHMKDEIQIKGCNHDEICAIIDDWMDYYNNERYQWDLAKLSPNEYYAWLITGFYPLGGSAPKPPEFIAFVLQSDENDECSEKSNGDDSSPPVTSQNLTDRSGHSPVLPYPACE